jgi:type III secretory pathway component EscU
LNIHNCIIASTPYIVFITIAFSISLILFNQYIIRKKMKLSLGPSKNDEKDYKEYQTYARQILHYLNNRARLIQRSWRRCISDPMYKVCRERLQNEYQDMSAGLIPKPPVIVSNALDYMNV